MRLIITDNAAPTKLEPLPSSFARELKGLVWNKERGVWMRRIFCANCGKPQGFVNLDMTFAFSMCDAPCWEEFGLKTEFMGIPDAIKRKEVADEQLAEANHKRSLIGC